MFLHSDFEEIVDERMLYCLGTAYLGAAYQGVGAFHSIRPNSYFGTFPGRGISIQDANLCLC